MIEIAVKLALAFLLALPLGWSGERRLRWAGLRTYALLSVCVCGFLLLGQSSAGGQREQADIFYGVLTGIGFVGYGAIVKSPRHARGITAAVSLWVTGAIGAGVAYGVPLVAAAVSLLSVVDLSSPRVLRPKRATP